MKLVVATVSNVVLADMAEAAEKIEKNWPGALALKLYFADKSFSPGELSALEADLDAADMAVLDLMGAPADVQDFILKACGGARGQIVPIGGENADIRGLLRFGALTAADVGGGRKPRGEMNPQKMEAMMDMAKKLGKAIPFGKPRDLKNYAAAVGYWRCARKDDMQNLLYLLLRDYGGCKKLPAPKEPRADRDVGVCRPADLKRYESAEQYAEANGFEKGRPTVALLYYGHSYPNRTADCVAQIADKLSAFANVLPVAFASAVGRNQERLKEILQADGGSRVDLIVNFMSFRLGAGPMGGDTQAGVSLLRELGVPVLHPFFMSKRGEREWRDAPHGVSPGEFLISVMLPELDGCIETYPVGAMRRALTREAYGVEIGELALIEERAEKLVSRVKGWLNLRAKPEKDKKVAIVCYNYPPGEDKLFGGAFLDTFASAEALQRALIGQGYTLGLLTAKALTERFAAGGLVNSGRWAADAADDAMIRFNKGTYDQAAGSLPMADEIVKQWGRSPGGIMTEGDDFLIPGLINGNVFIGLQPSRGLHEDPEKAYHDKSLPPHHQYIAFYKWLRDEFRADVVLHVGTHGTLEFLAGKECGMSGECFPDLLVGDIPHAYLYYTGNPAEAMIAKRRAHAVLVGYQPPVFMEGELYGELARLEGLIGELREAQRADPRRCADIREEIGRLAESLRLEGDLQALERELYRMRRSLMPKGLHTFGKGYTPDEAFAYMQFVLRYDRGGVKAPRRLAAELEGLDYDRLLEENDVAALSKLDAAAAGWAKDFLRAGRLPAAFAGHPEAEAQLKAALEYGKRACEAAQDCRETEGFLKVLSGEYLPVRLAGDMIRSPEVLPAGYNLCQFDPRLAPSEAAAGRGARIAENTLAQYRARHGEYPKSTAVILWGLETSRTQGETVGQILRYLGVRAASRKNLFQPVYEIIPLGELGRPRIDVVVNICGFFRDIFPNLIDDLGGVFQRVAALDEPEEMNYLKAGARRVYQTLLEKGHADGQARELSAARLFGPAEAQYGTGVTGLIETKNWTNENQLGEAYISSLRHIYSKNYRGFAAEEILNAHLKAVDLVSQVRSSHEYEVTDLDHYYEFFGGLSKSVEMAKGQKAAAYITDTTTERAETETVGRSIERGVRTRLLNPKWIDGMLEHPYHGAQKIGDRFENLLGLAATTGEVDTWIFSGLFDAYVADEDMRRRMTENNRWAYYGIVETMMEIHKRGYWQASEKELETLRQAYLSLEGDIEEQV